VEIHDGPYNRIKNWDYVTLMQAFSANDGNGIGMLANNEKDLTLAIKIARDNRQGPTLIECALHRDDCSSYYLGSACGLCKW